MAKDVEKQKKGGGLKRVIIIFFALIVIGAGTFAAVYFYMQNRDNAEVVITQTYVEIGKDMTINLNDEDSKRFLKASVSLGYDEKDKDAAKEIASKSVEIKDKTIFYLKSKKAEEFTAENEENLKSGLVNEINKLLVDGKILDVYFDNIITQ